MLTIFILALVGPFLGLLAGQVQAGTFDGVDMKEQLAIFAVGLSVAKALPGFLKLNRRWDVLPLWVRRAIISAPIVGAVVYDQLVVGTSLPVSLGMGLATFLASYGSNRGDHAHEVRKGHQAAPPPSGDAPGPVGSMPTDPAEEDG